MDLCQISGNGSWERPDGCHKPRSLLLQKTFFVEINLIVILRLNRFIMGLSKTTLFTPEQNRLASRVKALGHPARIAILQQLIREDSCICGELVDAYGLAQATISQHLKALKSAGWIQGNTSGVKVCYCIDNKKWAEFRQEFEDFMASYQEKAPCC